MVHFRALRFILVVILASCIGCEDSPVQTGDSIDSSQTDEKTDNEWTQDLPAEDMLDTTQDFATDSQEAWGDLPEDSTPPDVQVNDYPECKTGANCLSGICIQTPDGKVCTMTCIEECPLNWECVIFQPSLPDEVYVCAPPWASVCRPCTINSDCMTNGMDTGQACVRYGPEGSFCGAACDSGSDCPEDYECLDVTEAGGAASLQCVLTLGECPCNNWFVDDGAHTSCFIENDWGTCDGQRICSFSGLTDCDASTPEQEVCNKLDDDCDGTIDEDISGHDCLVQNQFGSCPGSTLCVDGNPLCEGQNPKAEQCDGEDNDCDGQTDEGFADTDGDGIADCMETDKDGDGIADGPDNCPDDFNPGQDDHDYDNFGDACDADDDNDEVPDSLDCAPFDKEVYPNAEEICDGKDNNCNYLVDEGFIDTDQDGWKDCIDEDDDNDLTPDAGDCAPLDANTYPGAEEICDGYDNNCNLSIDEGYPDLDNDGEADCVDDDWDGDTIPNADDNCPLIANTEQADQDQDDLGDICDPDVDGDLIPDIVDNCPTHPNSLQMDSDSDSLGDVCDPDIDGDNDPNDSDCGPHDPAVFTGATELCDGKDNDCNGLIDDEIGVVLCGKGVCQHEVALCINGQPADCDAFAGSELEACDGMDNDCDGLVDEDLGWISCGVGQCTKTLAACTDGKDTICDPLAEAADEICDGLDNDCDSKTDEDLGTISCGEGQCYHLVSFCIGGVEQDCDPYAGALPESCDGLDNDCDGDTDEELGLLTCGLGECQHDEPVCTDGKPNTCNPFEGIAEETCDGLDNNCNGLVDDGLGTTSCGLGICQNSVSNCVNAVPQACDPLTGAEEETCDGLDNDCNGKTDNDLGTTTCGLGQCEKTVANCVAGENQSCEPMAGWEIESCDSLDNDCDGEIDEDFDVDEDGITTCEGDCHDDNPEIYPEAEEVCNGVDDNCNDETDEGFPDTDQDGLVDCIDDDDDNDGLTDDLDGWPLDPDLTVGPLGGTGRDGDLIVSDTFYADEYRYILSTAVEMDSSILHLTGVSDELLEGDELLIWKQQKEGAGEYKFVYVTSVELAAPSIVGIVPPLTFAADPTLSEVLVLRVVHAHSLTVKSGGIVTAHKFAPGIPGGAVIVRCQTDCVVEEGGSVIANALGFAGGPAIFGNGSSPVQGASYPGPGQVGITAANGGGGGSYPIRGDHGDSGGGGGFASAGAPGTQYDGSTVCKGGATYGDIELSQWHLGSGGGAGSPDNESDGTSVKNVTGKGGDGGGFIALFAGQSIVVSGSVLAEGEAGGDALSGYGAGGELGGGGAGSGGTIYCAAPALTLNQDTMRADGEVGGKSGSDSGLPYGDAAGGDGSEGRIRLDYQTLNDAPYPDGDETLTEPTSGFEGPL